MELLKDRKVIITGASRGIGLAIAKTFIREGGRVLLISRSSNVIKLADELGPQAYALAGDITEDKIAKNIIMQARKLFGGIDILVNNAGILTPGILGLTKLEDVRRMFEVNVFSTINLTQYAVRFMGKSSFPSIINLSSIAGTKGVEGMSAYCATKAAINGFTISAAKELAPKGIRVNAIAPGFIDTNMSRNINDSWFEKGSKSVRMGRIGQPKEIADAALYLASDLSSHVTGQIIGVDGGMMV